MGSSKSYFLVPGWDFPATSLVLGSIITSPTQPQLAIYKPGDGDIDTPVRDTERAHFSGPTTNETSDTSDTTGLFGTFLNNFGLGDEPNFHYDRKNVLSYSATGLHTQSFHPSDAFKRRALTTPGSRVAHYINASQYQSPVYMVTAVKTITGAGVTVGSIKGKGWRASVNIGAIAGEQQLTGDDPPPIVFAFRLMQLRLLPSGEITSVPFGEQEEEDGNQSDFDDALQEALDQEFGEDTFSIMDGFDEGNGSHCTIIASSPARVDLLTAGSARIHLDLSTSPRGRVRR